MAKPGGESEEALIPEESSEEILGAVRFDALSPTDFEDFCFDLLSEIGFVNVDWRKGTPLNASPSDRGRDIVAYLERQDIDGYKYMESWFVDCKHYERGVPPEALQGALTWAQAERPSTVLFMASGYLTNGAKDWIADYERNRPPFRIRVWEMPQLRRLILKHMDVAFNHDVQTSTLRRVSDILAAESELTDKLWYGRKPANESSIPESWEPDIVAGMLKAKKDMEERYGLDELLSHMESDFAWGMLSGKISAIRWILGYDWDMLDS
ncbi:restriction endonuclease [Spirillospora sp. NPDC127200]